MTDETKVPTPEVDKPDAPIAPPPEPVEPAPPRAGPVQPTPDVPPPPPPVPEPKVKLPKGMGPPGWMAPVAGLLLIIGLASFAYAAWSYVSGVTASLKAGEQALLAVKAMEDASQSTLVTQEQALTARGIELKRAAISSSDRSEALRSTAQLWGFVGIGPLLIGFILMIIYRKKKERARAARVR
jgi:hypothetical protein